MTTEDFVQAVKIQTSDAAVNGTIKVLIRPPGRKPREKDVRLSDWYGRLSEQDREMLALAVREAAELAVSNSSASWMEWLRSRTALTRERCNLTSSRATSVQG